MFLTIGHLSQLLEAIAVVETYCLDNGIAPGEFLPEDIGETKTQILSLVGHEYPLNTVQRLHVGSWIADPANSKRELTAPLHIGIRMLLADLLPTPELADSCSAKDVKPAIRLFELVEKLYS